MVAEKVLFHALLSLWCSCSAIGSDRYCVNVQTFISEWESLNLAASQRFMVPGNKYVHKMKMQLNPNISSPHAVSWPGTAGCVGKQCWGKVPLQGGAPGNSKCWRKKSPPGTSRRLQCRQPDVKVAWCMTCRGSGGRRNKMFCKVGVCIQASNVSIVLYLVFKGTCEWVWLPHCIVPVLLPKGPCKQP